MDLTLTLTFKDAELLLEALEGVSFTLLEMPKAKRLEHLEGLILSAITDHMEGE